VVTRIGPFRLPSVERVLGTDVLVQAFLAVATALMTTSGALAIALLSLLAAACAVCSLATLGHGGWRTWRGWLGLVQVVVALWTGGPYPPRVVPLVVAWTGVVWIALVVLSRRIAREVVTTTGAESLQDLE
jgi:hypothetical protein